MGVIKEHSRRYFAATTLIYKYLTNLSKLQGKKRGAV